MRQLPDSYSGPGLLDIQVNGYAGFDFNGEPDDWRGWDLHRVASGLGRRGVMVVLPTLITDDPEAMVARAAKYAQLIDADAELAARFPKLHIEGPFISGDDGPRGAHPRRHCLGPKQAPDLIDRLRQASGDRVGLVTLAPELDGAIELIGRCAAAGIVVAIGHTQASAETIEQAVQARARLSTHLGNGSHFMLPRLDNYLQRQLAEDRLFASFIPDGHHMPFTTLKNFIRCKTLARSILTTDAIAAAEMPPGRHRFAGFTVDVSEAGRVAKIGEEGLAGSALTLDVGVINTYLHCDVTFQQAWEMASVNPARLLGLDQPPTITVEVHRTGFSRR